MFLIFEECMILQNTDTGVPAYTHTHTHTYTYTHTHIHIHTHTHTCTHTQTHTHTYTHIHTRTNTHTQTHTHIHTHIHTQWGQAHKLPYQQHRCLLEMCFLPSPHTHTQFVFIFKGIEECMQYVTIQLLCLHSKIK